VLLFNQNQLQQENWFLSQGTLHTAIESTLQMLTQFLILILQWLKQMSNIQIGMIHIRNNMNGIFSECG